MIALLPILSWFSSADRLGFAFIRVTVAVVSIQIGAVKLAPYEADGITPLVANNPVLSSLYKQPGDHKSHLTREGELVPVQREWQARNGGPRARRRAGLKWSGLIAGKARAGARARRASRPTRARQT